MHMPLVHFGKACVRQHRDLLRPVLRQPAHVVGHFLRAGGAVKPHAVDVERVDDSGRRRDVATHQQRAGGFHRHLHHNWQRPIHFRLRRADTGDRRFDLQGILRGFDQERVGVAKQQPFRLQREGFFQLVETDVTQAWQFCARPDGADDEARTPIGKLRDGLVRQLAGATVDFDGLVLKAEFAQRNLRATEGIGFDRIAACSQILNVHIADKIRAREV
jgi:hypothetical protein